MICNHSAAAGQVKIVRYDGAAVAVRAEVLAGIETKASNITNRTDSSASVLRTVRLRTIFYYAQLVSPRYFA